MSSSQKVWLVTGAAAGFGLEMCKQILERGDLVLATARNPSKVPDSLTSAGAHAAALDVTAPRTELDKVVASLWGIYGHIDYLINNAGYAVMGSIEETTEEDTLANYVTNVFGPLSLIRAILPHFRNQKSGSIINISSIGGACSFAGNGIYCSTKFALEGLTEALAQEVAPWNISVILVEPGYFRTSFLSGVTGGAQVPAKPIREYEGTPGRVAVEKMHEYDMKQPGDPVKGVAVMLDVAQGVKKGGHVKSWGNYQLVMLGNDTSNAVGSKMKEVLEVVEETKSWWSSTDHDDVKH